MSLVPVQFAFQVWGETASHGPRLVSESEPDLVRGALRPAPGTGRRGFTAPAECWPDTCLQRSDEPRSAPIRFPGPGTQSDRLRERRAFLRVFRSDHRIL